MRLLVLPACFFCFIQRSFCQAPGKVSDSLVCLKVEALFENVFDHSRDPYLVTIYKEGILTDSVTVTYTRKKLAYVFERNGRYRLKVSKTGFVPMIVAIETSLPPERANVLYRFEFQTRLISEKRAKSMNRDLLDAPMAVIRFDAQKKAFYHDEEYTRSLKLNMAVHARHW